MQIDATTLSDLEVLGSRDGSGGLVQLIDRTVTSHGHAALVRRLQRPPHDAPSVRRAQEAVLFFARHANLFDIDEDALQAVGRYLRSNIAVAARSRGAARLEYAWMWLRYRDLARELEIGVGATCRLFVRVQRLCSRLGELEAPEEVADVVARLARTTMAVLGATITSGPLLEKDRAVRVGLRRAIEDAFELLGTLDALSSMGAATRAFGWVMPELIDSHSFLLEADGVYHPFVRGAVRNPVRLTGGEPMVFLTGPNMAGKTTYLRTVALAVLLAQVGMGVPARRMRLTPVEALFTSLNPADNLKAGVSYFLAEVLRVKVAATLLAEGRRALILFDEVFKGTNVRDALDASAEVILGFARARRSGFIFSSHLAELVQVLESNDRIRFCCFDGDVADGALRYTYELREGVSERRLGLLLLRQARVPELLERISA
jgi:DNA mismatch repair ATPase MutS